MDAPIDPVPFVRVVTLDFNGGELIVDCVRSLVATDWPADRFEVVCVDNASTDGSIETIEREFPSVRVIRNGANLGFPGNNVAMRDLDGIDHVALINSDTVVGPGWLRPLVARAEADPGVGAVCPKILFSGRFVELRIVAPDGDVAGRRWPLRLRGASVDGVDRFARVHVADGGGRTSDRGGVFEWCGPGSIIRVPVPDDHRDGDPVDVELDLEVDGPVDVRIGADEVGFRPTAPGRTSLVIRSESSPVVVVNDIGSWLDDEWTGHERGLFDVDRGQYDHSVEVGTWCGAAVLLRRAYLDDVGAFEESFFLYYEDTDLSVRGRGRGWRHVTEPRSIVRHVHSASTVEGSATSVRHIERNHLLLMVRHAPARAACRAFVRHLLVTASYVRTAAHAAVATRRSPDLGIVRTRLDALAGAIRLLPDAVGARRRIAARRLVGRADLQERLALGRCSARPGPD